VWLMDGVNRISGVSTTPTGITDLNWQVAGTGDFNLDGKPDILWQHVSSGKFVVWLMDGVTRTSGAFLVPPSQADLNWRVVSARDFDRDGKGDLLWRHAVSGRLVLWGMDGLYRKSGTILSPD